MKQRKLSANEAKILRYVNNHNGVSTRDINTISSGTMVTTRTHLKNLDAMGLISLVNIGGKRGLEYTIYPSSTGFGRMSFEQRNWLHSVNRALHLMTAVA